MATAGITRQAIKILSKFIREGRNPDAAKAAKKALNVTKFTKPQQKIIQDLTGEVKPISAKSGFPIGKTGFKNSPQTKAHRAASGAARVQNMIKKGNYPKQVGLPTYEQFLRQTSKDLGVPYRAAKQDPGVMGALQLRRGESAFYPERNTPTEKLFDKYSYKPEDFKSVVEGRADLTAAMDDLGIFSLIDDLGIMRAGSRAGSIGHTLPMHRIAEMVKKSALNNLTKKQVLNQVNNPAFMSPEVNFLNQNKRGIESFLYDPKFVNRNLAGVGDILDEAQMTTRVLDPETLKMVTYGMEQGLDPKQLREFLKRVLMDKPFGVSADTGKTLPLPNRDFLIKNYSKGGKVDGYAAGGIGRLGLKLLQKLAKNLSKKELQMILGTQFKGTKPLLSPAKIREDKLIKKLGPDRYRWRNVKSEIPGPKTSLQRKQEREFFDHTQFWPFKGMSD